MNAVLVSVDFNVEKSSLIKVEVHNNFTGFDCAEKANEMMGILKQDYPGREFSIIADKSAREQYVKDQRKKFQSEHIGNFDDVFGYLRTGGKL